MAFISVFLSRPLKFLLLQVTASCHIFAMPALTLPSLLFLLNFPLTNSVTLPVWHSDEKMSVRPLDVVEGVSAAVPTEEASGVPSYHTTPYMRRFSPYELNGGTTVALAGETFCIVAGDTRMSSGYEILSRQQTKLHALTSKAFIATAGCHTDVVTLRKHLDVQMAQYKHKHDKEMASSAVAQMLSNTLYYRRFFPYYAFCMVAGLDEEGKGAVYGYDAIGSYKRDDYGCMGTGQNYIMPLLDNLIAHKNRADVNVPLTLEEALSTIQEAFTVAGERDIYTGDSVEIVIMQKDMPVRKEVLQLKRD